MGENHERGRREPTVLDATLILFLLSAALALFVLAYETRTWLYYGYGVVAALGGLAHTLYFKPSLAA